MFATPVFVRHVHCLRVNEALQRSVRLRGVRQQKDGFTRAGCNKRCVRKNRGGPAAVLKVSGAAPPFAAFLKGIQKVVGPGTVVPGPTL